MSAKNEVPLEVKEEARALAGLKHCWEFDREEEEYYNRQKVRVYDAYLLGYQFACKKIAANNTKKGPSLMADGILPREHAKA